MTSTRYLYWALISIVLTLSGCATTQIPTDIKVKMATTAPVIAYFSRIQTTHDCGCSSSRYAAPYYSSTPVDNGYYRLLLGRDTNGLFLIQDFYQKNKQPQTSPLWVKDPMHVFNFDSEVVIGSGILYYPDGKVLEKFNNIDRLTRESELFYQSGERALTFAQDRQKSTFEYWYKSGKRAAKDIQFSDQGTSETEAWDEDGNKAKDATDIIDRIIAELKPDSIS